MSRIRPNKYWQSAKSETDLIDDALRRAFPANCQCEGAFLTLLDRLRGQDQPCNLERKTDFTRY